MKWQGRERSSNVEDRRGAPGGGLGRLGGGGFGRGLPGGIRLPMGRGGGIGGIVGFVIVIGIIALVSGINPLDMLTGSQSTPSSSSSQSAPGQNASQDRLAEFVSVVVKETENLWTETFRANNMTYDPPKVVLFTEATQTACGVGQASSGPFYCPNDKTVYIDLSFYEQLNRQFGAPGDFAQAYVIAHEIGHAVQDQTAGLGGQVSNEQSVKIELQADCYAGVWANYAKKENLLESGDFEEAMNAANQIGDDVLTRGRVSPREFTHGTAEQRRTWFNRGYQTGDPGQCDTGAPGAV